MEVHYEKYCISQEDFSVFRKGLLPFLVTEFLKKTSVFFGEDCWYFFVTVYFSRRLQCFSEMTVGIFCDCVLLKKTAVFFGEDFLYFFVTEGRTPRSPAEDVKH